MLSMYLIIPTLKPHSPQTPALALHLSSTLKGLESHSPEPTGCRQPLPGCSASP